MTPHLRFAAPRSRGLAVLAGLVLVALAGEGYLVFVHPFGATANRADRTAGFVGEVAGPTALDQTFQVGAAGFDRLSIHARPAAGEVEGRLVMDLIEIDRGQERPRFRAVVGAQAVADAGRWDTALPDMQDSRWRRFRVIIALPDARPGHGLALLVNRRDTLKGESLHLGGREQWGDLVFETGATRATVWRNLRYVMGGRRSPLFVPAMMILALHAASLASLWCALVLRRG